MMTQLPMSAESGAATDQALLAAYAARRDAQAFGELVRRYAGLVYATSLRVTRNQADAEDVTQDCFLQLAKKAGNVAGSLPSFLYVLARHRALEFLRSSVRRQRREDTHIEGTSSQNDPLLAQWRSLSTHVDDAIAELPAEDRELVIRHFLQGQTQSQIAADLVVNQGTISRRLDGAVQLLRNKLKDFAPALTPPLLAAQLSQHALAQAPAALCAELGKIAIAGISSAARKTLLPRVAIGMVTVAVMGGIAYPLIQALLENPTPASSPSIPAVASAPAATAPAPASSVLLHNVPRIGFDLYPDPFPGCFVAAMDYLKTPVDYDQIMSVSGAAFRRVFSKGDGANIDLSDFYPEPYHRAFKSMGYDYEMVSSSSESAMMAAIKKSLVAGKPVFAFGIIGPPECGLVTGYDPASNALLGYSYFQTDPSTYYYQPDWYTHAHFPGPLGMFIVGDKHAPPSQRKILTSTLQYAIDLSQMTAPPWLPGDHSAGLSAYDAWATALETDSDYPPADKTTMDVRILVQSNEVSMTEDRASAATYLRAAITVGPEAQDELLVAADLYDQVAAEAKSLYPADRSRGPAILAALSDPKVRRQYAAHVRSAKEKEIQALAHLQTALTRLK